MGNPWRGEVSIGIDGQRYEARLTLGALAELEAAMEADSLLTLVERFEGNRFSSRDLLALLAAGLRGGGATIDAATLEHAQIEGGPMAAARAAAELLARAFTVQA